MSFRKPIQINLLTLGIFIKNKILANAFINNKI